LTQTVNLMILRQAEVASWHSFWCERSELTDLDDKAAGGVRRQIRTCRSDSHKEPPPSPR